MEKSGQLHVLDDSTEKVHWYQLNRNPRWSRRKFGGLEKTKPLAYVGN